MIHLVVQNDQQELATIHDTGPLEFGRAAGSKTPRIVVNDLHASRDHLRIEETGDGKLKIRNLSKSSPVTIENDKPIDPEGSRIVALPATFVIGTTSIQAMLLDEPSLGPPPSLQPDTDSMSLIGQSDLSSPLRLTQWLKTLFDLQLAALGTDHFYEATAQALVELIGLDRGIVLVRGEPEWSIMANQTATRRATRGYSKRVVQHVVEQRRMLFECPVGEVGTSSLMGIEAVVAAPFFDEQGRVAGVVYGSRDRRSTLRKYEIRPLEALLVQLLAGIVGSGTVNLRHKIDVMVERSRFEQFCSAEVAAELQLNPKLLDGAEREVSVVFADVRDFTALSEQIKADDLYKVLIGVMDQLTACILESGGCIIDYFGDAVCAMWNAPLEQPDHAVRACQAAQQIVARLPQINAQWAAVAGRQLDVGIGISTGRTWVGNAGSSQRLKYGPRGHVVNLASRIQGATKRFDVHILVAEATRKLLSPSSPSRRMGRTLLSGLPEGIELYELQSPTRSPAAQRAEEIYEQALKLFERAELAESRKILEAALEGPDAACPSDGPLSCLYGVVKTLSTTGATLYAPMFRFNQK